MSRAARSKWRCNTVVTATNGGATTSAGLMESFGNYEMCQPIRGRCMRAVDTPRRRPLGESMQHDPPSPPPRPAPKLGRRQVHTVHSEVRQRPTGVLYLDTLVPRSLQGNNIWVNGSVNLLDFVSESSSVFANTAQFYCQRGHHKGLGNQPSQRYRHHHHNATATSSRHGRHHHHHHHHQPYTPPSPIAPPPSPHHPSVSPPSSNHHHHHYHHHQQQ